MKEVVVWKWGKVLNCCFNRRAEKERTQGEASKSTGRWTAWNQQPPITSEQKPARQVFHSINTFRPASCPKVGKDYANRQDFIQSKKCSCVCLSLTDTFAARQMLDSAIYDKAHGADGYTRPNVESCSCSNVLYKLQRARLATTLQHSTVPKHRQF